MTPHSPTRPKGTAHRAEDSPGSALPRVVIAGGSGSLGRLLAARLSSLGHDVRIITRRRDPGLPFDQVIWDGRTVGRWSDVLESDDAAGVALVNLAGKLVDVRPTAANVADLRSSRVDSTRALVEASRRLRRPLVTWLQASTTAIWSDAGEQRVTESTPLPDPGLPQMTGVAQPWEAATVGANAEHLVLLRTSIVLDRLAPALQILARLTRAGLGGRVGSGRQWFSWIHHEDWQRVAVAALGLDPQVRIPDGPLVAAAPHPLRNAELMAALRRHLHRPAAPPTPAPLLRIGAVGLRSDPALALTGRHCTSAVLEEAGFTFTHPDIDSALADIYG
ncbi:MAG: epimerase [Janibacter sp.]